MPKNELSKNKKLGKRILDESDSKLDNFRELLGQLKEIIDGMRFLIFALTQTKNKCLNF
jgi:hypothetical protein